MHSPEICVAAARSRLKQTAVRDNDDRRGGAMDVRVTLYRGGQAKNVSKKTKDGRKN